MTVPNISSTRIIHSSIDRFIFYARTRATTEGIGPVECSHIQEAE